MSDEIHIGDVGTVFEATVFEGGVAIDISAATTKNFILRTPTGTIVTKTASFSTNGSDGKLKYTVVANDLSEIGTWVFEVYLEMPTGKWHSTKQTFQVYANLS